MLQIGNDNSDCKTFPFVNLIFIALNIMVFKVCQQKMTMRSLLFGYYNISFKTIIHQVHTSNGYSSTNSYINIQSFIKN